MPIPELTPEFLASLEPSAHSILSGFKAALIRLDATKDRSRDAAKWRAYYNTVIEYLEAYTARPNAPKTDARPLTPVVVSVNGKPIRLRA